jgi:hypothetical protein
MRKAQALRMRRVPFGESSLSSFFALVRRMSAVGGAPPCSVRVCSPDAAKRNPGRCRVLFPDYVFARLHSGYATMFSSIGVNGAVRCRCIRLLAGC